MSKIEEVVLMFFRQEFINNLEIIFIVDDKGHWRQLIINRSKGSNGVLSESNTAGEISHRDLTRPQAASTRQDLLNQFNQQLPTLSLETPPNLSSLV
jgi:hypothetical protein